MAKTSDRSPRGQRLGVFCIESWTTDLRSKGTLRPLLELLEREGEIRFIYQRVASAEELASYLDHWSGYSSYELGFLALHGEPGSVAIGSEAVTVEELIDRTTDTDEPLDLNLRGKTVYFGSCSTMSKRRDMERFRRASGARLVCGYTKDVDWLEAAAFELLLLTRFAANANPVRALKPLYEHHRGFVKRVGFRSVPGPT
jgi:hypothetical protein